MVLHHVCIVDGQGSQPWAVQLEARAKWDAWSDVRSL